MTIIRLLVLAAVVILAVYLVRKHLAEVAAEQRPCPFTPPSAGEFFRLKEPEAATVWISLGPDGFHPKPIATWNPARDVWETDQACIFGHWAEFSETWPASGMTLRGTALPLPASERRTDDTEYSSLLGLLPTPAAMNPNDGEAVETWEERRQRTKERVGNGNGFGTPLAIAVQLLPTPRATDGTKGGPNQRGSSGDLMLPSAVMLLPTSPIRIGDSSSQPSDDGNSSPDPHQRRPSKYDRGHLIDEREANPR